MIDNTGAPSTPSNQRSRLLAFAALCALCVLIGGGYAAFAVRQGQQEAERSSGAAGVEPDSAATLGTDAAAKLLFLDTTDIADPYRKFATSTVRAGSARTVSTEQCQRAYLAGGRGLCLTTGADPAKGNAFIFDEQLRLLHTVAASGVPSRTRVSADGRYGSMTFFVFGHGYGSGAFSTQTTLVDMQSGAVIADLEKFRVLKDGNVFSSADFNFWGVTFARDSNRFYATLGTGGINYLMEGDIAAREMRVLVSGVECPSLSPDNTRIAFKKRIPNSEPAQWRLTVMDLATNKETTLAETRSVDDQAEWLNDQWLLYTPWEAPPAIWAVPADGSGKPVRVLSNAVSPSTQH